jgi:large conductance mechanosensitive channel
MRKMLNEFKDFVMRGNVVDMAVGIIIGVAFGKIVTSMVNDIIMPPIGLFVGKVNFQDLFINLSGTRYASLEAARAAGAPTINYGVFLNTVLDFLIAALIAFLIIHAVSRINLMSQKSATVEEPKTRTCPYCISAVHVKATRCPACTSELN